MTTDAKTSRRNLRVSPSDDALFREAAVVLGVSVSDFLVESGRQRAEMVLADRTQFVLGHDVWETFGAALDRDAEVNPTVAELLRRPRPA